MATSITLRQMRRDALLGVLTDPVLEPPTTTTELRARLHWSHPAQLEQALVDLIAEGIVRLTPCPDGDHLIVEGRQAAEAA